MTGFTQYAGSGSTLEVKLNVSGQGLIVSGSNAVAYNSLALFGFTTFTALVATNFTTNNSNSSAYTFTGLSGATNNLNLTTSGLGTPTFTLTSSSAGTYKSGATTMMSMTNISGTITTSDATLAGVVTLTNGGTLSVASSVIQWVASTMLLSGFKTFSDLLIYLPIV